MLGTESGTFEAWVFPLKLLRDFRLIFTLDGRAMPAESLARRVIARPGSFSVVYSGDDFQVTETFVVPVDRPGILVRLQIDSYSAMRIDAHFTRDFQLMWPAAVGAPYIDWEESAHGFILGADGQHYRALVASPDAAPHRPGNMRRIIRRRRSAPLLWERCMVTRSASSPLQRRSNRSRSSKELTVRSQQTPRGRSRQLRNFTKAIWIEPCRWLCPA